MATLNSTEQELCGTARCCAPNRLSGWSPPLLPADTVWKSRVDRLMPRTGLPVVLFFAAVILLLNIGGLLPRRWDLLATAVASLAAGGWCALNFWRCRHAHCLVTGGGWLALSVFSVVEVGVGHSLIAGDEGFVFVAVLGAGLLFECGWSALRGTNAVTSNQRAPRRADVPAG